MANIKKPTDTAARKPGRPPKFVEAKPIEAKLERTPPVAATKPFVAPAAQPVRTAPPVAAEPVPAAPVVKIEPVPVKAPEPAKAAAPVKAPEPVKAAAPVKAPEPVKAAAPVKVPEPIKAPAPVAAPEPIVPAASAAIDTSTTDSSTVASRKGNPMATTFAPSISATTPEGAQAMFTDIQSRAKASVEKGTKLAEEMGEFAKGNVEAVMTSGRIAAKGAETLGQEAVEYGKKSFEGAAAAFKTMLAAKSPTELFKLQSDYARSSFDAAVTEGSKLSEAWLKLVGEIAQPLSSRVALAAEKIKAPVA